MMLRQAAVVVSAVVLLGSCSTGSEGIPIGPERPPSPSTTTASQVLPELQHLALDVVAEGLREPVAVTGAPGIEETFIVERLGRLLTLSSGATEAALDITPLVGQQWNEQGFLNFVVHPDFPTVPTGYALYTNLEEDLVLDAFEWVGDRFDILSQRRILVVPQPHKYHQGGGLVFDRQGYAWLSFGDGGGIGDRFENGQNPATLNGTVIRIDLDNGEPYALPPTNPFLESDTARPEVWAFGLRNPWRIAVADEHLIIADVGQESAEEINVVRIDDPGHNFGWPIMEGNLCYEAETCDDTGLTMPVHIPEHKRACAIIGGPVYRGSAIPELFGHYTFGDYCHGWIRSAPIEGDTLGQIADWERDMGKAGNITSLGTDHDGELMVTNLDGVLFRVVPVR